MEKLQEIELTIKNKEDGIFAISLVENPAIEEDFVYLSKEELNLSIVDEEKRVVVGFALVPDKRILRVMGGKKFNIYFSKETVRLAGELYMKNLNTKNFTVEHEQKVDGISTIELWTVEDPKNDKSNLYGLEPKGGELVIMSKIDNDQVWNDVKSGKYKGYSIEAMFDGFEQLQSKTEEEILIEELKKIIDGENN